MRSHLDEIHQAGAELVIIGNGQPPFAAAFKKHFNLSTPLYVDPKLTTYNAAGLKRTKAGTVGPKVWLPALKALFTGHFQGRTEGDPYQQGGVFIIMPDNKVPYAYISKHAGDRPPVPKVLKALRKAQQEAQPSVSTH